MGMTQGKFLAKADPATAQWTTSGQKGTRAIEMSFIIEPGEPCAGERVKWAGYFTAKTNERTIESLQYAGCTFPSGKITDLTGLGSQVVQIVVEEEFYNGRSKGFRVAWVNDPNAGGKRMVEGDLDSFAAEMAGALNAMKMNAAKGATPGAASTSTDDVGF